MTPMVSFSSACSCIIRLVHVSVVHEENCGKCCQFVLGLAGTRQIELPMVRVMVRRKPSVNESSSLPPQFSNLLSIPDFKRLLRFIHFRVLQNRPVGALTE